jgi:hypothetical protein
MSFGFKGLNKMCKTYNLKISIQNTKVMAFRGMLIIRSKIVIDNQPTEQIKHFI